MTTLAPKLPYTHPFAGGYPRLGGQPLPTDPDAIDYLNRVAAADGAAVEVGVAMAVDDFFKGLKADGTFSAIKAACLLCGARTLAGALVPLVGAAPTNVADGFVSGDYTRGGATPGLKGDGTSYLDSGRANDADPQNDMHASVHLTESVTSGTVYGLIGTSQAPPAAASVIGVNSVDAVFFRSNASPSLDVSSAGQSTGFYGVTRSDSASFSARVGDADYSLSESSVTPAALNAFVFARNNAGSAGNFVDARIAFYSIGESLDLEALDARVTALVTAIGAAV